MSDFEHENRPSPLWPPSLEDIPSSPDSSLTPAPGTLLDKSYRVIRELGHGATGQVLLARDESLARDVAIKLFLSPLLLNKATRRRFRDEARTLARIVHPNVVAIYDFGTVFERPYFVMEHVPGPNLRTWLSQVPHPSVDEALGILGQICQGVQAIHDAGAVHHDLKPSNILLGPGYHVVITDLGLSRLLPQTPGKDNLTAVIAGTPHYIAPELIVEERIPLAMAPRIDIYALGVIAFELLTGVRPFGGARNLEVFQRQVSQAPPRPSDVRPELPEAFDTPVLQALSKKPDHRPATALELIESLKDLRRRQAVRSP